MGSMFSLLIPILAVAANMVVQIVLFRRSHGARYFASIAGGFAAGLVAFLALEAALLWRHYSQEEVAMALLVNGPTYVALAYCYCHFVQLGQTSIRVRLYSEIIEHPNGLSVGEVTREYADEALMQARIRRLLESGDIVKKGDRYFVGQSRFVHAGNMLFAAKRWLLGKSSEFE